MEGRSPYSSESYLKKRLMLPAARLLHGILVVEVVKVGGEITALANVDMAVNPIAKDLFCMMIITLIRDYGIMTEAAGITFDRQGLYLLHQ